MLSIACGTEFGALKATRAVDFLLHKYPATYGFARMGKKEERENMWFFSLCTYPSSVD